MSTSRTILSAVRRQPALGLSASRAPALAKRSYAGSDLANNGKPSSPTQGSKDPQSSSQSKIWTFGIVAGICGVIFYNFNPFRTLSPPIKMTGQENSATYEPQHQSQGVRGGGGLGKVVGGSDAPGGDSSAWKSTAAKFEEKK